MGIGFRFSDSRSFAFIRGWSYFPLFSDSSDLASVMNTLTTSTLHRFRWVLGLFMFALILSGITAFPLQRELEQVVALRGLERVAPTDAANSFDRWILTIR